MIVGSIGYEVHSGLGHLMRDFWCHGIVDRVYVVPHRDYPRQNWYPDHVKYNRATFPQFLKGLDVLLLFENAFYWDVAKRAKAKGTKIALIPNYEYTPFPIPVEPDLVICASSLDLDYYSPRYKVYQTTIPVDVPWKLRKQARVFVHNAGHGQRGWAKGTPQILEALQYVTSDIKLIVRGQPDEPRVRELLSNPRYDKRLKVDLREVPDAELWNEGDVFINAEQYNGMSLMLQEAYAAGYLVMTTMRYPMTEWLPPEPMIPVDHYVHDKICVEFDRAVVDPRAIAKVIDHWYNQDISYWSLLGKVWANNHSWDQLKPQYLKLLEGL